jgi:hypothetical protein
MEGKDGVFVNWVSGVSVQVSSVSKHMTASGFWLLAARRTGDQKPGASDQ